MIGLIYLDQNDAIITNKNTLEDKFINLFSPQSKVKDAKVAIVVSNDSNAF